MVRDIMSTKLVLISVDDTLWMVKEIMELGLVRHVPVVTGGRIAGVVSQRDLLRASLSNVMGIAADEQQLFLHGVKISEVMSKPAITVSPDDSIREAAQLMADRKIGCLPVVEDEELIGIVTENDLLSYFAKT